MPISMRLLRLTVVTGAVAVAPFGCDKRKLTEVEAPIGDTALRYDIEPGQAYSGHLKSRTAINTNLGEIVSNLQFDVDLVIAGASTDGGRLVKATLDNIQLSTLTPDGIPAAAAGASPEAARGLNGAEIRFTLDPRGIPTEMPEPPKDAPPQMQALLGQITQALAASFIEVPPEGVDAGQSWDAHVPKPDGDGEGELSGQAKGVFESLVQDEKSGEKFAKLRIEQTLKGSREAQGQKFEVTIDSQSEGLFNLAMRYPSSVKTTARSSFAMGDLNLTMEAEWTKGGRRPDAVVPETEIQEVTDPCSPDYVGPDACEAQEVQAITDPCSPDYVGPEACEPEGEGESTPPPEAEPAEPTEE